MAVRPLNSIAGFSVGDPAIAVIQANGDITTINLTANGVSDFGPIGNVIITGGNNGEFITTDGNGNLSFANVDTSVISNGNSSVSIPVIDGNVEIGVNGAARILVVTDTGVNVAGTLNALGNLDVFNANLGNLATANYIDLNNDLTLSNGNITGVSVANVDTLNANTLNVNVLSNLGAVSNITITGGSNGQALITDGNGNLSFGTVNTDSNRAAPMPYLIPTGESYIVNENFQGLYAQPITIDGELEVDGILIEVGFSVNANDNQVYYDQNGVPTGANGFTFNPGTNVFSTPGNIVASGDILPSDDITYSLGSNLKRWNNLYLSGNTIILGNSIISEDANTGYLSLTNADGGSFTVEGSTAVDTTTIANSNSNIKVLENSITFNVSGINNVAVLSNTAFSVGNIKTDNLLYANGTPWDLGGNPGGSNTALQFNDNGEFGGSANLVFNKVTNNLTLQGNASVSGGFSVGGNALITGNLTVDGNLIYINVEELSVEDPIINLQTTANGSPPSSNSGKDVGTALNYYDTQARLAFMGWDTSNAEFAFGSQTSIVNEVVTFGTLGNVRAQTFKGNVSATTLSGSLTTASQPNITSVGSLTDLTVVGNITANYIEANWDVTANVITANYLYGDGSNVTNVHATLADVANEVAGANVTGEVNYAAVANSVAAANISGEVANATYANTAGSADTAGTVTTNAQPNITSVGTLSSLAVTGNVTAGNVNAGNVLSANYLVSSSGCVTINGGIIAFSSNTGGIFNSIATAVNLGLGANVTLGSTTGTTTARGELSVGGNASVTGNLSANLLTGTVTTNSQPNITSLGTLTSLSVSGNSVSNIADANTVSTNSVVSKRGIVSVATPLTVIDSFDSTEYRTAKYVISSQNDVAYESLEVLLIHNNINSYVTVYGAINDGGGNTITLSSGINNGNVELRATGTSGNTKVRLMGTYIPII